MSVYYEQPKTYVIGYTVAGALSSIFFALWQLFAGLTISTLVSYINMELTKLFVSLTPICIEIFVVCFTPVSFLLGVYYTILLYNSYFDSLLDLIHTDMELTALLDTLVRFDQMV